MKAINLLNICLTLSIFISVQFYGTYRKVTADMKEADRKIITSERVDSAWESKHNKVIADLSLLNKKVMNNEWSFIDKDNEHENANVVVSAK